jgi:hypothetical protein
MKKVSVQFNLTTDDDYTHQDVKELLEGKFTNVPRVEKITSIEVNDLGPIKKGKK